MTGTVLVTGCSGFIGTHLCRALAQAGWQVRGLDRVAPRDFPGAFTKADIAQDDISAACKGATHVVHLAALASVEDSTRDPARARRDTVETTRRLLAACQGARRFVLASTAAVYGPDARVPQQESRDVTGDGVYARSKLEAEVMVLSEAPGAAVLRLFNVYGSGQRAGIIPRIVECAANGQRLHIQGDGEQTRDFLHVADAARAFMLALNVEAPPGGCVVNIGSGDEISINALVRLAVEVGGRPIAVDYGSARPGDTRRSCADISHAKSLLGFAPGISLAHGLADLLEPGAANR